jgi:hypothetical protein
MRVCLLCLRMKDIDQHDPRLTVAGEIPRDHKDKCKSASWVAAEFCRYPRPRTRCPITNLSRTTLEEQVRAGNIRAKKLRKAGSTRGITLIEVASLREFVANLPDAVHSLPEAKHGREAELESLVSDGGDAAEIAAADLAKEAR